MLLKGILAQKSWPIDAVMGADCRGRGNDSWVASWLQSRDESAPIWR